MASFEDDYDGAMKQIAALTRDLEERDHLAQQERSAAVRAEMALSSLKREVRETIAPFLAAVAYETGIDRRSDGTFGNATWHREPLSLAAWFALAALDDSLSREAPE